MNICLSSNTTLCWNCQVIYNFKKCTIFNNRTWRPFLKSRWPRIQGIILYFVIQTVRLHFEILSGFSKEWNSSRNSWFYHLKLKYYSKKWDHSYTNKNLLSVFLPKYLSPNTFQVHSKYKQAFTPFSNSSVRTENRNMPQKHKQAKPRYSNFIVGEHDTLRPCKTRDSEMSHNLC